MKEMDDFIRKRKHSTNYFELYRLVFAPRQHIPHPSEILYIAIQYEGVLKCVEDVHLCYEA